MVGGLVQTKMQRSRIAPTTIFRSIMKREIVHGAILLCYTFKFELTRYPHNCPRQGFLAGFKKMIGDKSDWLDGVASHQPRTGHMMSLANPVVGTYEYLKMPYRSRDTVKPIPCRALLNMLSQSCVEHLWIFTYLSWANPVPSNCEY